MAETSAFGTLLRCALRCPACNACIAGRSTPYDYNTAYQRRRARAMRKLRFRMAEPRSCHGTYSAPRARLELYSNAKVLSLFLIIFLGLLLAPAIAFAADLALPKENVYFSNSKPLAGEVVRIYATVKNQSQNDARAVVKFFADGKQVGDAQPISILANLSSTVFVDWQPKEGYYALTATVTGANPNDENSENDTAEIRDFVVDLDTDQDSIFDTIDMDDDNDTVEDGLERVKGTNPLKPDTDGDGADDGVDEFPLDSNEKYDNDKDGIGNNADPDNDNDGVLNGDDPAPFDPLVTGREKSAPSQAPAPAKEEAPREESAPLAEEPQEAPNPPSASSADKEYAIEEVTYTFPDAEEAAYTLEVAIAKSKTSWNTYEFDSPGADPSFLYLWDFGDKTYAQESNPAHEFRGSGEYEVTLSVSDSKGGLGAASERISIGFWNIGNRALQLIIGLLGLFGAFLAGYLAYQAFFEKLFLGIRSKAS